MDFRKQRKEQNELHFPYIVLVCYLKVIDAIAFTQRDLENFQHAEEGSQPTQTLLPTASDTHQQCVTIGGFQDSADTASEYKHHK